MHQLAHHSVCHRQRCVAKCRRDPDYLDVCRADQRQQRKAVVGIVVFACAARGVGVDPDATGTFGVARFRHVLQYRLWKLTGSPLPYRRRQCNDDQQRRCGDDEQHPPHPGYAPSGHLST